MNMSNTCGSMRRRMPMPSSLTLNDTHRRRSRRASSRDVAAVIGVLRGVVEQVGEHLRQPHRVAGNEHAASAGSVDVQLVTRSSSSGRLVSIAACRIAFEIERLLLDAR